MAQPATGESRVQPGLSKAVALLPCGILRNESFDNLATGLRAAGEISKALDEQILSLKVRLKAKISLQNPAVFLPFKAEAIRGIPAYALHAFFALEHLLRGISNETTHAEMATTLATVINKRYEAWLVGLTD